MGYAVAGLNTISGCALRMFPDEISMWICGFRTAVDGPPQSGWASCTPPRVWIAQKAEEGGRIHPSTFLFLSHCVSGDIPSHLLPSDWDLHSQQPGFSGLWTQTELCHQFSCISSSQRWDWDSLTSVIVRPIPSSESSFRDTYICHTHTHAHTYVYIPTHICISDTHLCIYTDAHISIITKYICVCQYICASYICNIT